jgi:uncharacterized phage protein gp47/JayE
MAGLSENGFEVKRLPEIIADIEESEKTNINPNINTNDNELLGQMNNIIGEQNEYFWSLLQGVYDSFNPQSAEGVQLDRLAALVGISRVSASRSYTFLQEYRVPDGTAITTSVILENPTTGDRFSPINDVIVTSDSCYKCYLPLVDVQNNTVYTITVNGTDYDYTSDGNATADEIVTGVANLIFNAVGVPYTAFGSQIGDFVLVVADAGTSISVSSSSQFGTYSVTSNVPTQANVDGPIVAPAYSVDNVIVGVAGLVETTNSVAYIQGSLLETDEELRLRLLDSQSVRGTATVDAIIDAVSLVAGVENVTVFENDSINTVDGRPPKSFEVFAFGGDNQEIADAIWDVKAAGIETFGTESEVVADRNGNPHTVNFSRPIDEVISIQVFADPFSFPEDFSSAFPKCEQALVDYVNGLGVGEDVVVTRLYCALYELYPNASFTQLTVNGGTTDVVIADNEKASTNLGNVTVTAGS